MNRLILSFSLFLMIFGATTSPTWLTSNSIKAGLVTLISSSTSSDFDYNLTFSSSYSGTANVQVVPGIVNLQISSSTSRYIGLDFWALGNYTTKCLLYIRIFNSTTFVSLKSTYFSYDNTTITFISSAYTWQYCTPDYCDMNSGSGIREKTNSINFSTGSIDLTHDVYIMPFLTGFALDRGVSLSTFFSIGVSLEIKDQLSYNRVFRTTSTARTTYFAVYRVTYDQTAVQSTQQTYLDAQFLTSSGNGATPYNLIFSDSANYLAGINNFTFGSNQLPSFTFNTTSFGLTFSGNFINISTINYRYRSCVAPTIYYLQVENLCYDACPSGYYANTVNKYCVACSPGCMACTSSSSTACSSCYSNSNRNLVSSSCLCVTGYYDVGVSACTSCSVVCLNCSGTATNCTSCTGNRILSGNYCNCPNTGFADTGTISCVACSTVLTACLNCSSNTTCTVCDSSQYFIVSSGQCVCNSSNFRTQSGTTCVCNSGYIDTGTAICATCSSSMPGCLTCTSTSVCTSCNSAASWDLSGSSCICTTGYALSGSTCVACSSSLVGCTNCSSTSVCTTCNSSLNRVLSGGACVCATGYALSSGLCVTCSTIMNGCTSCTSNTSCTACNAGLYMTLSGSTCACMTGYALSGSTCVSCGTAMTGCKVCSSTTVCTTCDSSLFMVQDGSTCKCQSGYILSSGICTTCTSLMAGCTACSSASVCTACDSSLNMALSGSSCACQTNYTMHSGSCTTCSSLMYGCVNCSSSSACTGCDSALFTTLSGGSCVCQSGYALNGGTCITCASAITGCTSCTSASTCTACQSGYALQNSMCFTCGTLINGCTSCSSSTVCSVCDAAANMELSSSICVCKAGFTLNPNVCVTCATMMPNCTSCTSASNCTACNSGSYINSQLQCSNCIDAMPGCLTCTGSAVCVTCDTTGNFELNSSSKCSCKTGYLYDSATKSCKSCPQLMAGCEQCNSTTFCTKCTPPLTFTNNRCQCPLTTQYYNATTLNCEACNTTCLTCLNSTACLTCSSAAYRVLSENDCVCKVNYQLNASGDCEALSSCVQGFVYTVSFCKEICGDGLLFELECDDGNSDDGDGCSATCTIETNFTCKDGSPTTPSKCSYNKPIELELKKSVKDIYNNAVTFTISTFPQLRVLNAFNFSQILSSNLPTQSIVASYENGVLTVRVVYTQSIQDINASISVNPPTNMDNTFDMKTSSTTFVVNPENTEAYIYSEQDYAACGVVRIIMIACVGAGLAVMIIGIGFWKLIGVEMMNLLQMVFFCMGMVPTLQPLMAPVTELRNSVNGYNGLFRDYPNLYNFDDPQMPKMLSQMYIGARFLQNCNYMLACQLLILFIGLLFFMLSRVYKKQEQLLMNVTKFILNQVMLLLVIFNSMNFGYSLAIHFLFLSNPRQQPTISQIINLAPALLTLAITITSCVFVVKKNEYFSHNNRVLKKNAFARLHPVVLCSYRTLLGAIMGATILWRFSGVVVMALQIGYLVYVTIKRPYKKAIVTVRGIATESVVLLAVSETLLYNFYFTNKMASDGGWGAITNVPIWLLLALVVLAVLFNIACMILGIYKMLCKKKSTAVHTEKVDADDTISEKDRERKDEKQQNSEIIDKNLEVQEITSNQGMNFDSTKINLDVNQDSTARKKRKIRVKRLSDPLK